MTAGRVLIIGFLLCSILLVNISVSLALQINSWDTHTSFNVVNDILIDEDEITWGTTTGGIFKFQGNEFIETLTTQNGLNDLDAKKIANNPEKDIIAVGYEDGVIDLINKETNEVTTLDDIERADQFNPRSINDFAFVSDTMVVATDFGIVVYDLNNLLVSSTFTKLGSFNRSIAVSDILIKNDTVYAGTQEGIAFGNIVEDDLLIESNWTYFNQADGLPNGTVQSMIFFENKLISSINGEGNFRLNGERWNQIFTVGNAPALEFVITSDQSTLLALKERNIFSVNKDNETKRIRISKGAPLTSISTPVNNANTRFFVSTTAEGIFEFENVNSELIQHKPDGPSINFVDGLTFENGTLYTGTSRSFVQGSALNDFKTFNIFDGTNWSTFNRFNSSVIQGERFINGFRTALTDEFLYVGSWGEGILQQNLETEEIQIFNNANSRLTGVVNNQDFI